MNLPWSLELIESESAAECEIPVNDCKLVASSGKIIGCFYRGNAFSSGDVVEYSIKESSDVACAVGRFISMTLENEGEEE